MVRGVMILTDYSAYPHNQAWTPQGVYIRYLIYFINNAIYPLTSLSWLKRCTSTQFTNIIHTADPIKLCQYFQMHVVSEPNQSRPGSPYAVYICLILTYRTYYTHISHLMFRLHIIGRISMHQNERRVNIIICFRELDPMLITITAERQQ